MKKIAENERILRKKYTENSSDELCDRVMRAYGTLKYAHMISTQELYNLYADVRLGVCLGIIKDVTEEKLDTLLVSCMPATLTLQAGQEMTPVQRDKKRAEIIKKTL